MMWLARPKLPAAVAAALILATACVAVQARQKPATEGAREQAKTAPAPIAAAGPAVPDIEANRALARKQLALIDMTLDTLHRLAQDGRVEADSPSFSLWGRRKLETLRKTGAKKVEIVAELEKYIARLKDEEAMANARKDAARGTLIEVFDVQFRRMEAEIWLNEEKAR